MLRIAKGLIAHANRLHPNRQFSKLWVGGGVVLGGIVNTDQDYTIMNFDESSREAHVDIQRTANHTIDKSEFAYG